MKLQDLDKLIRVELAPYDERAADEIADALVELWLSAEANEARDTDECVNEPPRLRTLPPPERAPWAHRRRQTGRRLCSSSVLRIYWP